MGKSSRILQNPETLLKKQNKAKQKRTSTQALRKFFHQTLLHPWCWRHSTGLLSTYYKPHPPLRPWGAGSSPLPVSSSLIRAPRFLSKILTQLFSSSLPVTVHVGTPGQRTTVQSPDRRPSQREGGTLTRRLPTVLCKTIPSFVSRVFSLPGSTPPSRERVPSPHHRVSSV